MIELFDEIQIAIFRWFWTFALYNIQQSNKRNKSSNKRIDKNNTNDHRDIHFAQQIERVFEIEIYRKMQTNIENDQNDQKKISTQEQNRKIVKNIQKNQKSFESRCR